MKCYQKLPEEPFRRIPMNRLLLATFTAFMIPVCLSAATPVTFQVVSKNYVLGEKQPLETYRILFDTAVAYELPQVQNRLVTVYDWSKSQITLLDRLAQVQTTISTDDLVTVTARARAAVLEAGQGKNLGLSSKVQRDDQTGEYRIQFGSFEYNISTQAPKQQSVATAYGKFVDLAARLSIIRRLGPPLFGRMALNDQITADRRLPLETNRTIANGNQVQRHRSTLQLTEALTEEDRQQINQVQSMLKLYRDVSLDEFTKRTKK